MELTNAVLPTPRGIYRQMGNAIRGVFVSGGLAYIASAVGSLLIVDVTNPTTPTLKGYLRMYGWGSDIAVVGTLVCLCSSDPLPYFGDYGLCLIDVTNPTTPVFLGSYVTATANAKAVAVSRGLAYVAAEWRGLLIIDITNPTAPTLRGSCFQAAEDVAVSGKLVYVASGGLQVVDASNPSSPIVRGYYDTPSPSTGVYVSGGLCYLTTEECGLWILRYTGPAPSSVGPAWQLYR